MADQVSVNDRRTAYTATAGQTVFDLSFPVTDAADLDVYVNFTETGAFTLDTEAQTVTLLTPCADGDSVVLEGQHVLKRATGYPRGGALLSAMLNADMNNLIQMMQEARRDIGRAISLNRAEASGISVQLPLKTEGRALIWGADGIVNSTDSYVDQTATTAAFAATATAQATIATTQAGITTTKAAEATAAAATATLQGGIATAQADIATAKAAEAAVYAAAALQSWKGAWALAINYSVGDRVSNGGSSFICILAHSSNSGNEPGVGGSYGTYWNVLALKGSPGAGTGDVVAANAGSEYVPNAAAFRSNVGLAIGTNVQAYHGLLNSISGLGSTGFMAKVGSTTAAARTITGTSGKISITNGDGISGNPTITVGADIVDKTAATSYTAGAKQTFNASSSTAGLNIAPVAGDPSGPANGDIWYNSTTGTFKVRQAGATKTMIGSGSDTVYTSTLTSTEVNNSANSWMDTGLSITLTPKSAASKFYLDANVNLSGNGGGMGGIRFVRDGMPVTPIGVADAAGSRTLAAAVGAIASTNMASLSASMLDQPNTTSQITYKVQFAANVSASYVNKTGSDGNSADYYRGVSDFRIVEKE